ncbi:hypothetical protein RUND412_003847 [Rhizina undulata]
MPTSFDVIIVGAGPFGIIAAKTYLELNPTAELTIIETDTAVGGAWSKTRIYPGMFAQSPLGMIEFSDVRMKPSPNQFHDYVPAQHVYEYLQEYCKNHSYNGKSIMDRIMFEARVTNIQKFGRAWKVSTDRGDIFTADKLMLATGITSKPFIPTFPNENFTPPTLHSKDLARYAPSFLESDGTRNIVVLGGSKSAFDAVHMFAAAGKNVQWIIRDKGMGPAGMSVPEGTPLYYQNSHQILSTRLLSKMSPCIFEPRDVWMRFFHQSKVGRWITDRVWSSIQSSWFKAAKYDRSDDMQRLRPEMPDSIFWCSDNIGVSNTPGFWDIISKAKVYRSEITKLQDTSIHLSNGTTLPCDLLILSTGWDITFPFFTSEQASQFGLPIPISSQSMIDTKKWEHLESEAEKKILKMFPKLKDPPPFHRHQLTTTPFYLYRGMVSPSEGDGSIVFLGQVGAAQSFQIAETQSLWAAALLMGKLKLPDADVMEAQVAESNVWRRKRYLSAGERKPTFMYDEIAYVSMLLRELGVNPLRKGGGWKELMEPYVNRDYRGVLEEWKRVHGVNHTV